MREETYIKRCQQRIFLNLEKRRKEVKLRRIQKLNVRNRTFECDTREVQKCAGDDASDTDDLFMTPMDEVLWEKDFRADIEPYARALSLSFANKIITTLPREIRDQIYSYLLETREERVTVCDGKIPKHLRSVCNNMESHRSFWRMDSLESYFDPSYMGMEMAREIAELYYRTNTFYFDYHDLYLLHKFLTIDRFRHGFLPAMHVRSIELVLDEICQCSSNSRALHHYGLAPTATDTPADVIQWCVEQLLNYATSDITIKFIINRKSLVRRPCGGRYANFVQTVSPMAIQLQRRGHHVLVGVFMDLSLEWLKNSPYHSLADEA